jgi:hypothetical protein
MANLTNTGNYQLAALGQYGSALITAATTNVKPPVGMAFVAITMLDDCTFDTADGLLAQDSSLWASTLAASSGAGTNGTTITVATVFPKGITIYGRYNEIDLNAGVCIAYIG